MTLSATYAAAAVADKAQGDTAVAFYANRKLSDVTVTSSWDAKARGSQSVYAAWRSDAPLE